MVLILYYYNFVYQILIQCSISERPQWELLHHNDLMAFNLQDCEKCVIIKTNQDWTFQKHPTIGFTIATCRKFKV